MIGNAGWLPLCQTDQSEISGNTWGKWNNIFRLSGQQIEMAVFIFNFVTEFPNKGKELVCQISFGIFRLKYVHHLQSWSRIFRSEETETNLSTWILTEIYGISKKYIKCLSLCRPLKKHAQQCLLRFLWRGPQFGMVRKPGICSRWKSPRRSTTLRSAPPRG